MTTRVLIVDDELTIAILLGQSLQMSLPDCVVEVVHSGEEALSSMASHPQDLIIADVHMPGDVSGLELIGEVRCLDADVPVILMTGHGSAALRAQAEALGVTHYLDKPFDIRRLMAIAGHLLANQEKADD